MKSVLIPLADGFEEMEAVICTDILRRAGLEVITAGTPSHLVTGSRGIRITTDKGLGEVNIEDFDVLVLVGGDPGYKNLGQSNKIMKAVKTFADDKKKLLGAICAAPVILAKAGVLENKKATVYPGMEKELPYPRTERVYLDKNILTSQAPGTATEFALKIVDILEGPGAVNQLKKDMVIE